MKTEKSSPKTILMTGCTGLVGSSVIVSFARRRIRCRFVCITRGAQGESALERVRRALREECEFEGCPDLLDGILGCVTVVDGDLTELDVPGIAADPRLQGVDTVFHCAADVNLGPDPSGKVFRTNYEGTKNMVALALAIKARDFHLVSTAYVAGRQSGTVLELAQQPGSFNNPYEESKCAAESLVRNSGLPFSIYRPAIIVGRKTDGRIRRPLAFYRILEFLRKLKERSASSKGVDPSGWVDMNMNCSAAASEHIYFVPIDYVQESIASLVQMPAKGMTYHVTGGHPVSANQILNAVCKVFRISGVSIGRDRECRSPEERMFTKWVGGLFPYFSSDLVFDQSRLQTDYPACANWSYGDADLNVMVRAYLRDQFSDVEWVARLLHDSER